MSKNSEDQLRFTFEKTLEYQFFHASESIPAGFFKRKAEVGMDFAGHMLIARLTACVLGLEGPRPRIEKTVTRPKFPRYVPKWLQKRWSEEEVVVLDLTPKLVYPHATIHPDLGDPVKILMQNFGSDE